MDWKLEYSYLRTSSWPTVYALWSYGMVLQSHVLELKRFTMGWKLRSSLWMSISIFVTKCDEQWSSWQKNPYHWYIQPYPLSRIYKREDKWQMTSQYGHGFLFFCGKYDHFWFKISLTAEKWTNKFIFLSWLMFSIEKKLFVHFLEESTALQFRFEIYWSLVEDSEILEKIESNLLVCEGVRFGVLCFNDPPRPLCEAGSPLLSLPKWRILEICSHNG